MVDKTTVRNYYEQEYAGRWRRPGDPARPGWQFEKMWYRAVVEHVFPGIPLEGKRVCEIGSGYGYLQEEILGRGAEYIATDYAHSAVQQIAPGPRCLRAVADGQNLPFADRSMDVVLCMEVLEHMPRPAALLDECFRLVKPAGRVILTCPNYLNLWLPLKLLAELRVPFCRSYMVTQCIEHTFTGPGLRRMLAPYGEILLQRAARLHPPFFEQVAYRLKPGNPLHKINDWIFAVERRRGDRFPWRDIGGHVVFVMRPRPV